jgi:hypothetical protein
MSDPEKSSEPKPRPPRKPPPQLDVAKMYLVIVGVCVPITVASFIRGAQPGIRLPRKGRRRWRR